VRIWFLPSKIIMKIVDLTGKKFGKLTVETRISSSRNGSKLWKCLCDCGNVIAVTTRHLNRKNNNVRSCGCLKKRSGKEHPDWKGFGDISGDWWASRVVRSARGNTSRKKLNLSITIEDAWNLFLKQNKKCALTGLSLNIGIGKEFTASLDRIDSSGHYELDNVQWVHKDINFMKRTYSQEYFIKMCKLVAKN